jgi:hypothetical protein
MGCGAAKPQGEQGAGAADAVPSKKAPNKVPAITRLPADDGSIIVYSWRVVPPGEDKYDKYRKAADEYGTLIKKLPGLKTYMFAKAHTFEGGETMVADCQWFNSIGVFRAHMGLYAPMAGQMDIMKKMMGFVGQASTDEKYSHFKGYVFGGWDKHWVYPVKLSQMFPNFPPGKWFEFREPVAGFIRNSETSTENPPIIILMEHLVRDGDVDKFVEKYKASAASMEKNPKAVAMMLTKETSQVQLVDKDKIEAKKGGYKSANLLVSLETYEDYESFEEAMQVFFGCGLRDHLEGPSGGYMHPALPHTGEIWAEGRNKEVEEAIKKTFHPESTYKTYMMENGFSNHKTACDGSCPEVTQTNIDNALGDTELGKACPESILSEVNKKK